MRSLTLSEYRKLKGVTILELSEITGITEDRLMGLEQYRRRMSEDEAIRLSNFLECTVEELWEDNKQCATSDYVLDKWREYGQVPFINTMEAEAIINVLNDICYEIGRDQHFFGSNAEQTIKRNLINYLLRSRLRWNTDTSGDVETHVSTFRNHGDRCISWITTYKPPIVDKCTVVFEHIEGKTFSNDARWIIPKFIEEWTDISPVVKRRGKSFDEIRFLDLSFESGEPMYHEVELVDGAVELNPTTFVPPKIEKNQYRTYRKTVPSSEIPAPMFSGIHDQGCDASRVGECPHNTQKPPSESNGCRECRIISLTWKARTWLLQHFTDVELYRMDGFYDFELTWPMIYALFIKEFEPHCKALNDECGSLFSRIQSWLEFNYNSDPIEIYGRECTSGRHRASIAKAMKIDSVPVFYTSTKHEKDYLIRG